MTRPFLPFHVPDIGEDEVRAVVETLRSGWLTTGPKARAFEEALCRRVGAAHGVAVNSGTAALHLALEAAGIREGDEVLVPAMTFASTAEVVLYLRARPIMVDCEPDTLNMDPWRLEAALTPRARAVVPVHFGGHPCDMDPLLALARARGLKVIEDAAHALPASVGGRTVGSIGDVTCFSFYATKTITTGEGGMAVTGDPALAERMRLMSLHGISRDAWKRYAADGSGSWRYEILEPGFKYNMTDIAASLGLAQLARCDELRASRGRVARLYDEWLKDAPGLTTPRRRPGIEHAWHLYVVQLDPERLAVTRDRVIELLYEAGIGSSVHFIPLHLHPFYRKTLGARPEDFPAATRAFERILSLPIYPRLTDADVARVVETLRAILKARRR